MTSLNGALDGRIQQLFEETLNIEVQSAETDLIEGSLLDSLVLVELMVGLEDTFGIRIDVAELDIEDFRTVHRIGQLVARLGASEAPDDH
jgi:D-alanine--poly(phosphoribitol) ligase subunit 2